MERPSAGTAFGTVAFAAVTAALQWYTVTSPATQRADANRNGNYTARDALKECRVERQDFRSRFLECTEARLEERVSEEGVEIPESALKMMEDQWPESR